MGKPNVLFLHSHNTGRYIEPYGFAIPSPRLQALAKDGILFRRAFAAGPTCSPSRASFMTGMYPHTCGMLGLAHRGFALPDYDIHLARLLRSAGYRTAISGVEHTAPNLEQVGYDEILAYHPVEHQSKRDPRDPVEAAVNYLESGPSEPFFLSVGLTETHRPFPKADPHNHPGEDPRYLQPPRPLPDHPETRADMADFAAAVRQMDGHYGRVLDALDAAGLSENTAVFCFCDHGLQFPRNMCNLTDHGLGVYLIIRGPGGFHGGRVVDEMVSLIDLVPTVCGLADLAVPERVEGRSLLPLISGQETVHHAELFGEVNFHAAYEAMRTVRTARFRYVRRYDHRAGLVLPNVDDTPSKAFLLERGWTGRRRDQEMLYDLVFDPDETDNRAEDPAYASIRDELAGRLDAWMEETGDPLRSGPVPAPPGSEINDPDDLSPEDPTIRIP